MNPLAIIGLLGTIVQGIPEIESAMGAIGAAIQGNALTPADYQALGQAMVAAHQRVQTGIVSVSAPAAALNVGTVVISPPIPPQPPA